MEIVTLITMIIGFLGVFIMMLQLINQVKLEVRSQFKELKDDFINLRKDLKDETAALAARIDVLSARFDAINARIDKLADAIISQKAS